MAGEFDFIANHLRALAANAPGALNLTDDAAVIPTGDGALVVTNDVLVAGVHFLLTDPLDEVARKALRVNVSDLAAMGAAPMGYVLGLAWPSGTTQDERAQFAAGLAVDQDAFDVVLLGGDTTSTPGPLTISVTALGRLLRADDALLRSRARAGEGVYVTGAIGKGYLGLQAALGTLNGVAPEAWAALAKAYALPEPRLAVGQALSGLASAALDVSDGLIADLGHIASASNVRLVLNLDAVPVPPGVEAWLDRHAARADGLLALLTGGDDYELAFTAPLSASEALSQVARDTGVPIIKIGHVEAGAGLRLVHQDREIPMPVRPGFTHF